MAHKNPKIGVYQIMCMINRRVYIGGSVNIQQRWSNHKSKLTRNKHPNKHLQKDYNEFKEDQFICTILEECTEIKLKEREQYWMDDIQCYNKNNGYNIFNFSSSSLGFTYPEETKLKMSISAKKYHTKNPERKREIWANKTFEERSQIALKTAASKTSKEKSQQAKDGNATRRLWTEIAAITEEGY